jgi:sec-independent protein translocase protein TatA
MTTLQFAMQALPSYELPIDRAMFGMGELLTILAIVVVLFGASKLPQLGKGMGEAIGNFKKASREAMEEDDDKQEIDATPRIERGVDASFDKQGS